jgi:prepilin-type N-terminal cleavage/methylation domain-containing protein
LELTDANSWRIDCGMLGRRAANPAFQRCGWRRARLGFTLIEIMIAVSIVAIILATGIPAFVSVLRKDNLRRAVSDAVEACSTARSQSILQGLPMQLVIRADDGALVVQPLGGDPDDVFGESKGDEGHSSGSLFEGHLGDDVGIELLYVNFQDQMEFPETRVRFFPNGTCDEFTMILFSDKGQRKISLDVVTALADVEVLR